MRCMGLAILICLTSCYGFEQQDQDFAKGPFSGPDCSLMKRGSVPEIESKALAFFQREVGVKINEYRVLKVSSCANDYFVPVEATAETVNTPREWFIQVPKDGGKLSLIRPE